jgi:hypothetical protein
VGQVRFPLVAAFAEASSVQVAFVVVTQGNEEQLVEASSVQVAFAEVSQR